MQKRLAICLCFFVFGDMSQAAVTHLSFEFRSHLQQTNSFKNIDVTAQLPHAIFALCADSNGFMADPGKKWEPTDNITDPLLPRKRLIWAVSDGHYFVVHYEAGGLAHSYHFLVASVDPEHSSISKSWFAVGRKLDGYSEFLAALIRNELDDDPRYYH